MEGDRKKTIGHVFCGGLKVRDKEENTRTCAGLKGYEKKTRGLVKG